MMRKTLNVTPVTCPNCEKPAKFVKERSALYTCEDQACEMWGSFFAHSEDALGGPTEKEVALATKVEELEKIIGHLLDRLKERERQMTDREQNLLELAWGIIANVSGGDWDKQTKEWKAAATRWRDEWTAAPAEKETNESHNN